MALDDSELQAKLEQLEAQLQASAPPAPSATQRSAARRTDQPSWWATWRANFFLPLGLLAIPWTQELIDQLFLGGTWNLPVHPRSLEGIPGIFLSAFSHGDFAHLIGNSLGFAIFSWFILAKSRRDYWITLVIGWLGGGLAAWLLGPSSVHGLSGVVYTLFGYLLAIGWLERRFLPLLISVFVLINYSYFVWGIFPSQPMVAWWGHLFGLLLGVFAAYGVYREPPSHR